MFQKIDLFLAFPLRPIICSRMIDLARLSSKNSKDEISHARGSSYFPLPQIVISMGSNSKDRYCKRLSLKKIDTLVNWPHIWTCFWCFAFGSEDREEKYKNI